MKNLFKPDEIIDRYNLFDADKYLKMGYDTILCDIDDTIDVPDSRKRGSDEAFAFLDMLIARGYRVILFSNNTKDRVESFIGDKNYEYNCWSFKPLPFSYYKMMKKYNIKASQMISLGDQMLNDLIGANLAGLYTVYTKQLVEQDSVTTKINRKIERWIFKHVLHEEL